MSQFSMGGDGPQQMNQNPLDSVDFDKTTPIKCESCENQGFEQVLLLRKVSALVSPTGKETIVPVAVFACAKCGHINQEFLKTSSIV